MRWLTLFTAVFLWLLALSGTAAASDGEFKVLKANPEGPVLPDGSPAAATIHVTEPAAADECVFKETDGEITETDSNYIRLKFPDAKAKAEKCDGNSSAGFPKVLITPSFGPGLAMIFNSKEGEGAKIRVGTTCIYTVHEFTAGGYLDEITFPGYTETDDTWTTGELHSGGGSCAKEMEFKATSILSDPGNAEYPFYVTESEE